MMNTVTFLAAAAISLVASAAAFGNAPKRAILVSTTALAPSRDVSIPDPEPVMTLPDTVIVAQKHVKAHRKVWTCGAPRRLMNDAKQTVRECEWK